MNDYEIRINMKKVFIASRFGEFHKIRKKLTNELKEINMFPINLDDNFAVAQPPLERSLENIRSSEIVILLLGDTYGTVPNGKDKSYTHLEYEEAIRHNKLVFVFGIGSLYANNNIKYSNDYRMKEWQQKIENNGVLSKLDYSRSIHELVYQILFNVYSEVNRTWLDEETGLIWQVKLDTTEEHGRLQWQDIFLYCDNKNKEAYGGYTDWRIPTIDELNTIYTNEGIFNPINYDKETFIKKPLLYSMRMQWGRFWSATSNEKNYNFAYGINFNRKRGNSKSKNGHKEKTATRYVRCVRGWLNSIINPRWELIKDSKSIEEFEKFKKRFPNSKYETLVDEKIYNLHKLQDNYLEKLSLFERKELEFRKLNPNYTNGIFLKAIEDNFFQECKKEALINLKQKMKDSKEWKELSSNIKMPKNAAKKKKYENTIKIINMLESL